MSTLSIKLAYRPIRIGWCVEDGDFEAFRQSLRRSYSLWGGCFNPVIRLGDTEKAQSTIELFRVDCLYPASNTAAVREFIDKQTHLQWPDHRVDLVIDRGRGEKASAIADILAPIQHVFDERFKKSPTADPWVVLHDWSDDDPLRDVLLATYGGLPPINDSAHDFKGIMQFHLRAPINTLNSNDPLILPDLEQVSLADFNKLNMRSHYTKTSNWRYPGFYIGDATQFDDIVEFWNLRAAGISLQFYDSAHAIRFRRLKEQWLERAPIKPNRPETQRIAIWSRRDLPENDFSSICENPIIFRISDEIWNGKNIQVPNFYFADHQILAAVDNTRESPTISFAIPESPVRLAANFSTQKYIISLWPGIGLYKNREFTIDLPFIPKLNDFYSRNARYQWNALRVEPDSIGLIVDGAATDLSVRAIETNKLFEHLFKAFGISATPSVAGLVCNRLITQMGGIDGCRVFRIGGVRDLIGKYSPDKSFTTSTAKQIIRGAETDHPLSGYQDLYIESRNPGSALTKDSVFDYLVRKEIFRPGLQLKCPNCRLDFWRSIDDIKTKTECEYCGGIFNIGPQLRDRDWAYRRSGLFGRNDNQEGAIPVVLTLQVLDRANTLSKSILGTSMSLAPDGADIKQCETDFVYITTRNWDGRVQLALGECKTNQSITEQDAQNLVMASRVFPDNIFDVFIIFSKVSDFSESELAIISNASKSIGGRVILFSTKELEPWYPYERSKELLGGDAFAGDLNHMAINTHRLFFSKTKKES